MSDICVMLAGKMLIPTIIVGTPFSGFASPRFNSGQALISNISFAELTANWRFGSDPATRLYGQTLINTLNEIYLFPENTYNNY